MNQLHFQDYIAALPQAIIRKNSDANPLITSVTNDSRAVRPGSLFAAIPGTRFDGHDYLSTAVNNGAVALIVSSDFHGEIPDIPYISTDDPYFAWASVCECHAGYPAKSFHLHTVTGTNGKTSTVFFLRHFLQGITSAKVGMLTTIYTDTCERTFPSKNTTPDAATIQDIFLEMKQNNVTDAVMESSSHGLHQHRAGRVLFHTAAFTNLTGDHLDYHGDMEHYYAAKKSLFSQMLEPDGIAVINTDDSYGKRLFKECTEEGLKHVFGFSTENDPTAFCRVIAADMAIGSTSFSCILDGTQYDFQTPLTGEFNLKNTVTAILMAYANGISVPVLQERARTLPQVPGRLQHISLQNGANAYVDYAHTDDALHMVLNDLRKMRKNGGKIITVFGCGGDRDRTKRPRMGAVVHELSDYAIITDDNPRTEASADIIQDILTGINPSRNNVRTVPNREEAIALGVSLAHRDDILLVAGKGHEDYQEINGKRIHFSDIEILNHYSSSR